MKKDQELVTGYTYIITIIDKFKLDVCQYGESLKLGLSERFVHMHEAHEVVHRRWRSELCGTKQNTISEAFHHKFRLRRGRLRVDLGFRVIICANLKIVSIVYGM